MKQIKIILLVPLLLIIISCSEPVEEKENVIDIYSLTYNEANDLLEESGQKSEYTSYVGRTITLGSSDIILEKGSCGAYTGKTLLISVLDSSGQILRTIPQKKNKISECYLKLMEADFLPEPPYSPFYYGWEL